jgi:hypothetical protein
MYGAWILEPSCTHTINRKVNIDSENEKGAEGLWLGTSVGSRPIVAHREAQRVHFGFVQRKSWKCQAASHVEMTATHVKETRTGRA